MAEIIHRKFILTGPIPSKKNSRVKPRNCNFTIPSSGYFTWQDYAQKTARLAWRKPASTGQIKLHIITNCRNDLDNLTQSIMDALEKIVYEDDRQVRDITARKVPKNKRDYETTVEIWVLEE